MRRLVGAPLLLAATLAALLAWAPSGYYVITPGGSYDVGERLEIPEGHRQEMGQLAFTAVYAREGSWARVLEAGLDRTAVVVPAEQVRPPGVSPAELSEINRRLIEESKSIAAVVALRAAGYDARVTGQGAEVNRVLEGMPVDGVLRPGDVIVAVDDQPVQTAVEVIEAARRHQVGDQVRLGIIRDDRREDVVVGTRASAEEPGRPVIGAAISTRAFDVDLPFPVEIDTENVGGPSAGLMFALGILDAVTDGVLTRGHPVAGTGTIAVDGTVGPIGGAAQKVVAAERDGAEVFLVPRENYEDARAQARSAHVVAVDRFADAVRYLCSQDPGPDVPPAPPPPCATELSSGTGPARSAAPSLPTSAYTAAKNPPRAAPRGLPSSAERLRGFRR
jgi:Lon-like protease